MTKNIFLVVCLTVCILVAFSSALSEQIRWNKDGESSEGCHVFAYEAGILRNPNRASSKATQIVQMVMMRKDGKMVVVSPFRTIGVLEGTPYKETGFLLEGSPSAVRDTLTYYRQGFTLALVNRLSPSKDLGKSVCKDSNYRSQIKPDKVKGLVGFDDAIALIIPVQEYLKKLGSLRGYNLFVESE